MKRKNIAVIGRIACGVNLLDGQTIKTKILCDELKLNYPDKKIYYVDTYKYFKYYFTIIKNLIIAFINCEYIFVLLSKNGRKFFFPIIMGLNKIFHRKVFHDVIGGALPEEAKNSSFLRRQLQLFDVNWVETYAMKQSLLNLGIRNVEVLPNFKRLDIISEDKIYNINSEPYIFVMFSRIIKEKGIEEAAKSIYEINHSSQSTRALLHIYGPIDDNYRDEFEDVLNTYGKYVSYKGCISYDKSVDILSKYYMLLFPSIYSGEGIAGTIIDALSSGLPVIATDWHFNAELVKHNINGFCYHWEEPNLLKSYIAYAIDHPDEINAMRYHCILEAKKYTPEVVMKKINDRIN